MNEKETRLAQFCHSRGVEGVILRRRSNIAWLTEGADTHIDLSSRLAFGTVVWTPSKKTVYADVIEAPRLRVEEFGSDWEFTDWPWVQDEPAVKGNFATDWPTDEIAPLRYSLTMFELQKIRALGAETAEIMCRVMKHFPQNSTEHQLAGQVSGKLREEGIYTPVMLVASDERISQFRHPIPTGKQIERIVLAAVCAERDGLVVSMTRLVHFGKLDAELKAKHEAVCKVDAAYHAATNPGTRWCDALAAGLKVYKETGFENEWLKHHQGGPMGYELREFKATPTETRVARTNQLAGWNPSITGTKSEDTIVAGGEVLTVYEDWPMLNVSGVHRPDILERR
jgi:antitoxin VapB